MVHTLKLNPSDALVINLTTSLTQTLTPSLTQTQTETILHQTGHFQNLDQSLMGLSQTQTRYYSKTWNNSGGGRVP